jgi:hypothetical protein
MFSFGRSKMVEDILSGLREPIWTNCLPEQNKSAKGNQLELLVRRLPKELKQLSEIRFLVKQMTDDYFNADKNIFPVLMYMKKLKEWSERQSA